VHAVANRDRRRGHRVRAVARRASADEAVKEGAVGLEAGGLADADEPAAALDVVAEGGLLRGLEHVAARVDEDHRAVLVEVRAGERGGGIGARVDLEVVRGAERLDRRDRLVG
jgi:hypothetical protein